jgi:hypothetical protein
MALGSWNQVPDRPGWIYGLSERHPDGTLSVEVFEQDGQRSFEVTGRYWTSDGFGEESIATKAQREIDALTKEGS